MVKIVRQAVPAEGNLMPFKNKAAQQSWDRYERGKRVQSQLNRKYREMLANGNGLYEGKQFSLFDENKNLKTGG